MAKKLAYSKELTFTILAVFISAALLAVSAFAFNFLVKRLSSAVSEDLGTPAPVITFNVSEFEKILEKIQK